MAYGPDALCTVGVAHGLASRGRCIGELEQAASQSGLRELTARALMHRARAGELGAAGAASALAAQSENPALHRDLERATA